MLAAEHLVRAHAAQADAGIRNLDLAGGVGGDFVRDDDALVSQRMRDKPVVRNLQEGCDSGRLVSMAACPVAHGRERRQHRVVRWKKESVALRCGPLRQLVVSGLQLVRDLFDARDLARAVLLNQPVPEGGAEIEAIVQILTWMKTFVSTR